jgi:hypothetical protein
VSGDVALSQFPKPVLLGSTRVTGLHRYYEHLRLPPDDARSLAVYGLSAGAPLRDADFRGQFTEFLPLRVA